MTTPPALALNFRKSLLIAASIALACPMLLAQNTPSPAFDVATIKPHDAMVRMIGAGNTPDGFTGSAATLSMLLMNAYGLRNEDQISGIPDWARAERFDIQAKISAADMAEMKKLSPAESQARRQLMLQALLADRFKLKAHTETKQLPVYELVVAKGPSKLVDSTTDTNPKIDRGEDGKPHMGIQFQKDTSLVMAYSMSAWAGFLSQPVSGVGRPVLDKTGLTGTYDFPLNWSVYSARPAMPSATAGDPATPDDTTSIFAALKDVGLQLHSATGPIETIVIDHVEHPTAD